MVIMMKTRSHQKTFITKEVIRVSIFRETKSNLNFRLHKNAVYFSTEFRLDFSNGSHEGADTVDNACN